MKIAVVTCYRDPDYIRARTLRAGLQQNPDNQVIIIKNKNRGLLRYPEIIGRIIWARITKRPDAWLLTFRGYEMLPFLLFFAWPKPVIFDELINLVEWTVDEHNKIPANSWSAKLLEKWYRRQLNRCRIILADTAAHADYSAKRSNVSRQKYLTIPVGADETLFRPQPATPKESFEVFYYGSMLPLHGVPVLLNAAEQLKNHSDIQFRLIGGGPDTEKLVATSRAKGANINYQKWLPFEQIPQAINQASLCLGGPFGDTIQADKVVTGKAYQFLACAAPTVIGKNSASDEFVDKVNCLLVPLGDANALAAAIIWAYDHPQQLEKIGQAGRELYQQKFSINIIAQILVSTVERLEKRSLA